MVLVTFLVGFEVVFEPLCNLSFLFHTKSDLNFVILETMVHWTGRQLAKQAVPGSTPEKSPSFSLSYEVAEKKFYKMQQIALSCTSFLQWKGRIRLRMNILSHIERTWNSSIKLLETQHFPENKFLWNLIQEEEAQKIRDCNFS